MNDEVLLDFDINIKKFRLSELASPEYNPKKSIHDDPDQYKALFESIRNLGYIDPIIVNIKDGKNIIVSGNQRYSILCDMAEEKKIPLDKAMCSAVVVDFTNDKELSANVGCNNIGTDFIIDKLKSVLEEIEAQNNDLMVITGFTDEEIEKMFNDIPVEKDPIELTTFKIRFELPVEYESVYEMYLGTNGEESLRKEIIKVITSGGTSNGCEEKTKKPKNKRTPKADD